MVGDRAGLTVTLEFYLQFGFGRGKRATVGTSTDTNQLPLDISSNKMDVKYVGLSSSISLSTSPENARP